MLRQTQIFPQTDAILLDAVPLLYTGVHVLHAAQAGEVHLFEVHLFHFFLCHFFAPLCQQPIVHPFVVGIPDKPPARNAMLFRHPANFHRAVMDRRIMELVHIVRLHDLLNAVLL